MSRVQERSENLVRLLKEAAKLVRAEQVAAEALGALGTHYAAPGSSPRLAQLGCPFVFFGAMGLIRTLLLKFPKNSKWTP